MYLDTVLFIIGAGFSLVMIIFFIYFIVSRKRSRVYTEALKQESENFDAITATLRSSQRTSASPGSFASQNTAGAPGQDDGFNPNSIAGAYVIVNEVGGGAMSRTFIVRSAKLGNFWFMKYIHPVKILLKKELPTIKFFLYLKARYRSLRKTGRSMN